MSPNYSPSPALTLSPEVAIPQVGFGTYLIPQEEAQRAVRNALDAGYRHVDTAEVYGNEAGVGAALAQAFKEQHLTRDQVFVTTKLWPGNAAWGETPKTRATTHQALEGSLGRLGLDAVDLYLLHAPFDPEQRLEEWAALAELQQQGKTRAIGVSNFSQEHIEALEEAGLPLPSANQIELHPWSQKHDLVAYLESNEILPIAYSSLVPLSTWRANEGKAAAKTKQMLADGASEASPFRALAKKYEVTEAQILLRWAVQKGYAILPKTTSPQRLAANLDLFTFELDAPDMAAIATMDRGDGVAWSAGDPTKLA